MKIKFKMRSDGAHNELFTRAWDYAFQEYMKNLEDITAYKYNMIWTNSHPGKLTHEGLGFYQVEMEEKDYTLFMLRWA